MKDGTMNALEIQVDPVENAYAEEWIPLVVKVQRSDFWPGAVELRNISIKGDKSVQLDLDLLDRQMVIQPGEACRFTVPIKVLKRGTLSLDSIFLQVGQKGTDQSEQIPLPKRLLSVRPAIGKEIDVKLETICQYDEGTKATLRIKHKGNTAFSNLTVNLSPETAISSGKHVIQRKGFALGDEERVDLVLAGQEITVDIAADAEGDRCLWAVTLKVAPAVKLTETWYRFLEPSKRFDGEIEIHEIVSANEPPEALFCDSNSWWPVRGGLRYQILIRPNHGQAVESISIRQIADMVVVRTEEKVEQGGRSGWKFVIDVINHDLFCKSEVINFDVETKAGKEIGEIPVLLMPQPWKHWKVAAILGATMTLQGVTAIPKIFRHADDPFHLLADFRLDEDYNLLFLLTIPVAWLGLKIADWLVYRFQG